MQHFLACCTWAIWILHKISSDDRHCPQCIDVQVSVGGRHRGYLVLAIRDDDAVVMLNSLLWTMQSRTLHAKREA